MTVRAQPGRGYAESVFICLETYLDTVDVRLDVASFVQVQNVHRPEERAPLGERHGSHAAQHLLGRCPPPHTLGLSVPVNSLNVGRRTQHKYFFLTNILTSCLCKQLKLVLIKV